MSVSDKSTTDPLPVKLRRLRTSTALFLIALLIVFTIFRQQIAMAWSDTILDIESQLDSLGYAGGLVYDGPPYEVVDVFYAAKDIPAGTLIAPDDLMLLRRHLRSVILTDGGLTLPMSKDIVGQKSTNFIFKGSRFCFTPLVMRWLGNITNSKGVLYNPRGSGHYVQPSEYFSRHPAGQ